MHKDLSSDPWYSLHAECEARTYKPCAWEAIQEDTLGLDSQPV